MRMIRPPMRQLAVLILGGLLVLTVTAILWSNVQRRSSSSPRAAQGVGANGPTNGLAFRLLPRRADTPDRQSGIYRFRSGARNFVDVRYPSDKKGETTP